MKNLLFLITLFIIGCSSGDKKVDSYLNKYEEVVKKWESKGSNSQFTLSDISEMNSSNLELLNEANKLKGNETWSDAQLSRFSDLTLRFTKMLTNSFGSGMGDLDKSLKDLDKATKDFEKEMQIVSYTYKEMPIKEINWILVEGGPRGDFNISETEITFAQFDKFCEETGYSKPYDKGWGRGTRPVKNVNVEDANKFCEWLSEKTGRVIRLPEEDEWEFAARGGNKSNGYEYSGSDNLDNVGWYDDNSGNKTHEVGTKKPNELGIYDMSGNVWEWAGTKGYIRGGSLSDDSNLCSVSSRIDLNPEDSYNFLGFRVLQNSR